MEKNSKFNVNTLLCGLLTIVFVVLKLVGVIDWSWWWVLAPVWIPLEVGVIVLLMYLVYYLLNKERIDKERKEKAFYEAMGKWRN